MEVKNKGFYNVVEGGSCPSCRGLLIIDNETGELTCSKCGLVFGYQTPASSSTTGQSKPVISRHMGVPSSLAFHDKGLTTEISEEDKDATGKTLSGIQRHAAERMRIWDKRSPLDESKDRNLKRAMNMLWGLAEKLSLSQTILENAAYIYRKALERDLLRGRAIPGIVGACIYAACRNAKIPRTLEDVANALGISKKELAKYYRLLVTELSLNMPLMDPILCVTRIANSANLSERTKRKALEILRIIDETGFSAGKNPMGLAASAIYVAALHEGEKITQSQIAKIANVTEITVRNRSKGIINLLRALEEQGKG
ncbi:hypothetical protein HRbin06_00778 [archaeon HR06]|nr:hypothetical protein HRbin06_00778 [archaeon HR06]